MVKLITLVASILILSFIGSPVFAQLPDLKVDNSTMPAADIDQVFINKATGQLVVLSVPGVEYQVTKKVVSGSDVVINSFTINNASSASLQVGDTATLRWSTTNAELCTASATPANSLADWNNGTVIGIGGPASVTFAAAGDFVLQLDCSATGVAPASATVTVRVGGAVITSFTVTPDTATSGSDVTLTLDWTTQNTIFCSGSANWPNSTNLALTGTQNINITGIAADIVYTLSCDGLIAGDTVTRTATVTVNAGTVNCSNVPLTSGVKRQWTDLFRNAWPGPKSQQVRVTVPTRGYYSIAFNTGNVNDSGNFSNIEAAGTRGARLGAISRCPGGYDVVPECSHKWTTRVASIKWDTTGQVSKACQLQPNTTYYWNITFTDGTDPNTSSCVGTFCQTYFVVSNRDFVAP